LGECVLLNEEECLVENHFTIVILSYNNEKWVKRNVNSAIKQEYNNFDIRFINDASIDSTGKLANKLFKDWEISPLDKKNLTVVHNPSNTRALSNLYSAVDCAKPGSIIVTLDGDDWLANRYVLKYLNEIYQDPKTWITAGSYIESVGGKIVRPRVTEDYWTGNIRHKDWTFSHLRTFRRELFMSIDEKDMKDHDGDFYKFTWDRVIMYPMVEMAGRKHFRPVDKITYVYNRENPLAVDKIHRQEQLRIEAELNAKKPYDRLRELPISDYL
jgi:glycosyltransferase involved in cell wall biosynthesis